MLVLARELKRGDHGGVRLAPTTTTAARLIRKGAGGELNMMTGVAIVAAATLGVGLPVALALLVPMEAGVPIPVPDDLVMLVVGERVAAGALAWWAGILALEAVALAGTALLFLAARAAGAPVVRRVGRLLGVTDDRLASATSVVERRGHVALAIGRATPGLRTVTGLAAGTSGIRARRALPALFLGATVFAQLHLVLGYALGPVALDLFDAAKGPAILVAIALVVAAAAFWVLRRGRHAGTEAWREAACPACLALGLVGDKLAASAARNAPAEP
jgi:membrane protein DedA with SNARE-associated domain